MSRNQFEQVVDHARQTAVLQSTLAVLEWDERTGLPSEAGGYRAEQMAQLSGIIHRRRTDPKYGGWLDDLKGSELAADEGSNEGATILRLHKDFQRNTKLPVELIEALSKATVLGQQAWEKARKEDDWSAFKPHMQTIFDLRRQQAELLAGRETDLYDVLLDEYEEDASSKQLTRIFAELREGLVELIGCLQSSRDMPKGDSWKRRVDIETQRKISRWIAEQIGFDFQRGRLDETAHPFCATLGPNDCRILTRYQAGFFPSGFFGTLHEAGHGLYEQGLPREWFGLPPGSFGSLGIHESQSRMWENFVGRSRPFWEWCFPQIQRIVGGAWGDLDADMVFRDVNLVRPSLIRVEADEVTYNLHILIRFEIEQELISRKLEVEDAVEAWNQKYQDYLGICPPSARDGILQDVHWSGGLIGYFPTYALGNLYAAQLMKAASEELGSIDALMASGQFRPLLEWLREHIHRHGFLMHPGRLIERSSKQALDAQPLLDYLKNKLFAVYRL
jgi:carboxypeptidase Taq